MWQFFQIHRSEHEVMKTHKEAGDMTQTKVQTESPETYANKMGSYNLPEERI